jgi:hypothetical protein
MIWRGVEEDDTRRHGMRDVAAGRGRGSGDAIQYGGRAAPTDAAA